MSLFHQPAAPILSVLSLIIGVLLVFYVISAPCYVISDEKGTESETGIRG
jgi:hypothetical protein